MPIASFLSDSGWYPKGASVATTVGMWKPLTHDGVTYESREDWNAYKAVVERNTGQKIVEVSNSDRHERADFHKHRAWEARRARGIDSQQWAEIVRERKNGYDPISGRHFGRSQ